jgi:hypothetical protein
VTAVLRSAVLGALTLASVAAAAQSPRPVHVHRQGLGQLEAIKAQIGVSIEACRAARKLPPAPTKELPPDGVLEKLALVEKQEYFDGLRHAAFVTHREVAADPSSATCELALFHERSAWAGTLCGDGTGGQSTPLSSLLDYTNPGRPKVDVAAAPGQRSGCNRPPKAAYDVAGLPTDQAGGHACVWMADIVARTAQAAGLKARGHDPKGTAADQCVYARLPAVVVGGRREMVVLKTAADTSKDVANGLFATHRAVFNEDLVKLTDGSPLPADTFTAAAVKRFLEQPAKLAVPGR